MFSLVPTNYEDVKLWQGDSKVDRRPPKRRPKIRR